MGRRLKKCERKCRLFDLFLFGRLCGNGGRDMEQGRSTDRVCEGRATQNSGQRTSFSDLEKLVPRPFEPIRGEDISLEVSAFLRIAQPDWFFPAFPFLAGQGHFFSQLQFLWKRIQVCAVMRNGIEKCKNREGSFYFKETSKKCGRGSLRRKRTMKIDH